MTLSVILVDDHPPMRELLAAVFTRAGALVREAESAAQATLLFDQNGADLVVMDQNMPGMSGVELIAQLRARSTTLGLILVTGQKSAALAEEARQAGADAVMVKPVSPRALMETVNAIAAARAAA